MDVRADRPEVVAYKENVQRLWRAAEVLAQLFGVANDKGMNGGNRTESWQGIET